MTISTTQQNKKLNSAALKLAAVLFWVLIWQFLSMYLNSDLLLPSPLTTVKRLSELINEKNFWLASVASLLRITVGCTLGIISGTLLGAASALSKAVNEISRPLITVIRATPVASFIILALLWIERDSVGAFISFLMVVPILWANISEGIKSCDKNLLEMANVFEFSKIQKIKRIYIPSVMPYFLSGCTTAMGLSWKAGVAAEVLSLPKYALGSELYYSKIYLEMPSLFAVTLVVILMSILLEKLLSLFIKRFAEVKR